MIGLLVAALLLLMSAPAWATTYYVGKSGNNSNSCATAQSSTAGNRKLTITGASGGISCLSAGDTLIIGDGVYDEAIAPDTIPSGTGAGGEAREAAWAGATTVRAENLCTNTAAGSTSSPSCTAILRPSTSGNCSPNNVIHLTNTVQATYIILQGFEADANSVCEQVMRLGALSGPASPNHIRLQNVYFHDSLASSGGSGLFIVFRENSGKAIPDYIELLDSTFTRHSMAGNFPTLGGNHCLYFQGSGTIRRNIISYCSPTDGNGQGIATHSDTGPYVLDISGNDVSFFGYQGIELALTSNTNVYNNIVHDDASSNFNGQPCFGGGFTCAGIALSYASGNPQNTLVANNTVYNISSGEGGGIAITGGGGSGASIIRNNILFGGTDNTITGSDGGTLSHNRCNSGCATSANPQFVSAAASNFHLLEGSAMIGAGVALGTVTIDFDGVARANPPSIGAFEGASPPASAVAFSDLFNRADNSDLGTSWTPEIGRALQIVNMRVRPSVINFAQEEIVTEVTPTADQYAKFTISTFTSGGVYGDAAGIVRAADPSSMRQFYVCYAMKNYGPGTSEIGKFIAGVYTTLTISSAVTWAAGDKLECRVVGTTISLHRTPSGSSTSTQVLSTTDSSISSGRIGIEATDLGAVGNVELDNYNAGDYPPATPVFPDFPSVTDFPAVAVTDTFDRANSGTLGANWTNQFGSDVFSIVSNQAVAGATASRILYTASQATGSHDIFATWVTAPAAGSYNTMLIFSSLAASDNSQYRMSLLRQSSANAFIKVEKIDSGGSVSATPVAATDLGGDVADGNSFGVRVSGTTLSVYWKYSDGIWYRVAQVTDATLPTADIYGGMGGLTPSVVNDFGIGPSPGVAQSPPQPFTGSGASRFGTTFPGVR